MTTTIPNNLRKLKLQEIQAICTRIKERMDEIQVHEKGGAQPPEYWTLQADNVKIYAEIGWRERNSKTNKG